MKPVFKENKGNGVPDDFYGWVMFRSGEFLHDSDSYYAVADDEWRIDGDNSDVLWYETKRETKAKYKKEPCIICCGKGSNSELFFNGGAPSEKTYPCTTCNGRGYKMELIK